MRFRHCRRAALAVVLAAAAITPAASAVTVKWTNPTTGIWNDAANWDLGIPGNDDAQVSTAAPSSSTTRKPSPPASPPSASAPGTPAS